MPKFGILITTYFRKSGLSKFYLSRSLKSILNQSFLDWKLYLIGDCYKPENQFFGITQSFPKHKIYQFNLPNSPERDKYSGETLWKIAGFTAQNLGLAKIREECQYFTRLDDDDFWLPDHLKILNEGYKKYPESAFIYTQSTYKGKVLPTDTPEINYNNLPPRAYNLIHSATSWDVKKIPFDYVCPLNTHWVAADALMWETIREHCDHNNYKTLYLPYLTVHHDEEGAVRTTNIL